jgi:hypothetical protein
MRCDGAPYGETGPGENPTDLGRRADGVRMGVKPRAEACRHFPGVAKNRDETKRSASTRSAFEHIGLAKFSETAN